MALGSQRIGTDLALFYDATDRGTQVLGYTDVVNLDGVPVNFVKSKEGNLFGFSGHWVSVTTIT